MITVLQRVQHAKVEIDGKTVGATEQGLLILLGVAEGDTQVEADKLVKKIANLRIFEDENGKMNLSLLDIGGGAQGVSHIETGVFGADMAVTLLNDGPVTIILDTKDLK